MPSCFAAPFGLPCGALLDWLQDTSSFLHAATVSRGLCSTLEQQSGIPGHASGREVLSAANAVRVSAQVAEAALRASNVSLACFTCIRQDELVAHLVTAAERLQLLSRQLASGPLTLCSKSSLCLPATLLLCLLGIRLAVQLLCKPSEPLQGGLQARLVAQGAAVMGRLPDERLT